ncbi:hypothetical protein EON66_11050 [archaeon]|nr:MAG: hypothetical protein EON66_11050 [archaeon]
MYFSCPCTHPSRRRAPFCRHLTTVQESADERWRPILGVEQVLVSVIAMLNDPNISSPANVDAAVQFRDDPKAFRRRVRDLVARSLEE